MSVSEHWKNRGVVRFGPPSTIGNVMGVVLPLPIKPSPRQALLTRRAVLPRTEKKGKRKEKKGKKIEIRKRAKLSYSYRREYFLVHTFLVHSEVFLVDRLDFFASLLLPFYYSFLLFFFFVVRWSGFYFLTLGYVLHPLKKNIGFYTGLDK